MEFFNNLWNTIFSANSVLFMAILLLAVFIFYAVDLVLTEVKERKIYGLLHRKIDIEEYLNEVTELISKSKRPMRIAKYTVYKATGLFYKGENENALEWLQKISQTVENCNDVEVKIVYTMMLFRILFAIGYNEKVDKIFNDKKDILDKMLTIQSYKYEAEYILALYEYKKGNTKVAYKEFHKVKKMPLSRLDRIMTSFQLAKVCLELEKIEEAEEIVEEVMATRKNRSILYIYDELDAIIKERRNSSNTISSVDKDLEEQYQQEALEKMEKEVEEAIKENNDEEEKKKKEQEELEKKKEEQQALENQINEEFNRLKNDMAQQINVEQKIQAQDNSSDK